MNQQQNAKAKDTAFFEENMGQKLHDIGFGNDFGYDTKA